MLPSINKSNPWRQIGKVALGDRSGKNGAPKDLSHFILKAKNPADAKYYKSQDFHSIVGDEPKELDIILPFMTVEETIRDRSAMYGSNGLRQCYTEDGKVAHRRKKMPDGKLVWEKIPCPYQECEFKKSKKCPDKAIFSFMIPAIDIGTFYMDFGARTGAAQIYNALKGLAELCKDRHGGIRGLRCKLVREATAFDVDGRRVIKYIPTIHIDFSSLMQSDKALLGPIMGQKVEEPQVLSISADEVEAMDAEVVE